MYNVTHFLLVIGKEVIQVRLPFTKYECHSLAVGYRKKCNQTPFYKMHNVTHDSLAVNHRQSDENETVFHKMCNVTHLLLVIGKAVTRLSLTNVQCHSLAVGHINDVMRLSPFTKSAVSPTSCWS